MEYRETGCEKAMEVATEMAQKFEEPIDWFFFWNMGKN